MIPGASRIYGCREVIGMTAWRDGYERLRRHRTLTGIKLATLRVLTPHEHDGRAALAACHYGCDKKVAQHRCLRKMT